MLLSFTVMPYHLRVFSSWLINLSSGWFASVFLLLNEPNHLIVSLILSIICIYISLRIEKLLDTL